MPSLLGLGSPESIIYTYLALGSAHAPSHDVPLLGLGLCGSVGSPNNWIQTVGAR